jgi:hypothetical protein
MGGEEIMSFVFATCEPIRALAFINKMYPRYDDLTKDDVPLLYSLISKDILRVQDPDFHQPCQIIEGNKYSKEFDEEISDAIKEFQGKLKKTETQEVNV